MRNFRIPDIKNPAILLLGGALLVAVLIGSYNHYVQGLKSNYYQVFDIKETVSWVESDRGIYRKDAKGLLDNLLLSTDTWAEVELSLDLLNPRDCGLVFRYQDLNNFHFIFFNQQTRSILWGKRKDNTSEIVKRIPFPLAEHQKCLLKVDKTSAELFVNDQSLGKNTVPEGAGLVGFLLNDAITPKTIFYHPTIKGRLSNGKRIIAKSPPKSSALGHEAYGLFLPFYISLILLSVYLAFCFLKYYRRPQTLLGAETPDKQTFPVNFFTAGLVHLVLTVCIFWPFVSRGEILVSSYDNFGEIFPLYFLSKNNFIQLIQGQSLSLWNPLVHNGIPFYSNHWNMIYYPLNWLVFLFSDKNIMTVLTLRTFIEVFLVGLFAYGFFSLELGGRTPAQTPSHRKTWALFCSIVYQLCSLLIFTLSVFPSISLYFAMTVYLYLLWSIHTRRAVFNYMLLALAVILILTSANVAFIFYAALSLFVVSAYRFLSLKGREGARTFGLVVLSSLTGFLISAIRILPCFRGIADSNRIVTNYYTLHDRISMIIRFFLPEIPGWFGPNTFNALTSKNLQLYFEQMDLPSNSQNTFFVYFGILSALLLVASLWIRGKPGHTFWKIYSGIAIAIALLFQPFWGMLSILFFPLNHYSYHTIILPVGICALIGHTGIYLEENKLRLKKLGKRLLAVLVFIQCYILVFLTYLFPEITVYTRCVFLALTAGCIVYVIVRKYCGRLGKSYLSGCVVLFNVLLWVLFFFAATAVLLKPIPRKEALAQSVTIPFLSVFCVIVSSLYLYACRARKYKTPRCLQKAPLLLLMIVPLLIGWSLSSPLFAKLLNVDEASRTYFIDLLLGHAKLFFIIQAGVLGLVLTRVKLLSRGFVTGLFIIIAVMDLLAFNFRFDNVVAPFTTQKTFYNNPFPYEDIDRSLRGTMDLVNYRASALDKGGLNSNKSLIFGVPSYTGIMGYMPKRFFNLICHFGYPARTILIYPSDSTEDDRFLDLSAVKYIFQDEQHVTVRPTALSRLNLYYAYEVIKNEKALLNRLKDADFDPQKKVLLPASPAPEGTAQFNKLSERILLTQETSDKISAHVKSDVPAVVLFNESYDKGWKAFIDNVEVPVLIANYNFMACPIPPGEHEIRLQYEPQNYFAALKISIFGVIVFMFVALTGFTRRKKPVSC